jgi:Ni/Fe-hydrogenase subunit HybB-like protein
LTWYANLSEEAAYFVKRTDKHWHYLFYLPVILNWLIPFTVLITRKAKRSEKLLFRVCLVVMAGHWLDLYLMIMPVFEVAPRFGLYEILSFAGYSALFTLVLLGRLKRIRLVPVKDPYLEESLTLHN